MWQDPVERVLKTVGVILITLIITRVKRIEEAQSRIIRNRLPQERWCNFHVLSKSMGGFTNLRDKLLETKGAENPVMQMIVAG